jgi:hypothetical protein
MNHKHALRAAMAREEKSEHAQKGEARTHEARSTARTKIAGGDGLREEPTNEPRKTTMHNPYQINEFFIEVQNNMTTIY